MIKDELKLTPELALKLDRALGIEEGTMSSLQAYHETEKKIKAIGVLFGVKITVDKSLDKLSKVMPKKMEETDKLLANSSLNF